ncbi:Anti-sigma regulatory factor (Ser/Thr protein kinase) [Desulfotomaculum arcticum]|uniref:Anti-sigma regulatory factor (Ser/Thr protein kinase) n=2 Tax=Desulfotruncus TaxID=2867377 RepID=A0A1I2U4U9_9FIRM|nr:Anti-sigma regulatory factor (Ser/Thr protein kinase) [Desulfotomaculum arcticum] [Desulfotruncus arcticus DSM 17038]
MDFTRGGEAAAKIKKALQLVGMEIETIRRAVIVAYEAELNIVIHARHGNLVAHIHPNRVEIEAVDEGPGIPDIPLALQEGYSTAPPHIREMGFGAGMGLPNIQRCSDELHIDSEVDSGTTLKAIIINRNRGE